MNKRLSQYALSIVTMAMLAFVPSSLLAQEQEEPLPIGVANPYANLVDTSNGKLKLSYRDFSIPGRKAAFTLFRYYDSQSKYDGLFGYGWHSTYDYLLRYRTGKKKVVKEFIYKDEQLIETIPPRVSEIKEEIEITEMTGWLNTFVKDEDKFVSIHGSVENVTRITDGFLRTNSDGTKYYFTTSVEKRTVVLPQDSQKTWMDDQGRECMEI